MIIYLPPAHNDYRLLGTLAYADLGANLSKIQLFATTMPASGQVAGVAPLVEMILTDPCGVIVNNTLVLTQADVTGDLITVQGSALWGRWLNGNGSIVLDGDCTDSAGNGFFKLSGTSGTLLYAGARAILGVTALG